MAEHSAKAPFSPASLALTTLGVAVLGFMAFMIHQHASLLYEGRVPTVAHEWLPGLGVTFAFRLDGLSLLFGYLVTVTGILVLLYAHSYMRGDPQRPRLQLYLTLFALAMLGLVLADDLITLFVFWELTTLTSFLLIGYSHREARAREAARQALFVTGAGGLVLLAGVIMLGFAADSLRISEINALGAEVSAHPLYPAILTCVLIGAFSKSAQFPLHFWLPNAMAAPTPVSAYLHSATMVKAGVFLLARLHPALSAADAWFYALSTVGALTTVWGSVMALRQRDLKLMLAWTTVMGLGTLTLFLAGSERYAIAAAMTFLVVHALYKCALFLVAGLIDHGTGTRDLDRLGGIARALPVTFLAAAVAGLSMAGLPPFLGFIGKELIYEGALGIAATPYLLIAASVGANAMMVTVAGVIIVRGFFGPRGDLPHAPHEGGPLLLLGPCLLAGLGLAFGLFPELLGGRLIEPAVEAILATPDVPMELKLWHGVNVPFVLSVLTVALGGYLFYRYDAVRGAVDRLVARLPLTGNRGFDATLDGVKALAEWQTARLQSGRLGQYLCLTLGSFVLAVGGALLFSGGFATPSLPDQVPWLGLAIAVLIAIAALVTILSTSRLLAVCALGIAGNGIAALFMLYSAIDVAMTQLMVETLFVVIIAVVLLRLPAFQGAAHPGKLRDLLIAGGVGVVVCLLVLSVTAQGPDDQITAYYAQNSVPEAYGRNIVNVILVDFRALDTLGEIAVIAIAALAAIGLVRSRRANKVT